MLTASWLCWSLKKKIINLCWDNTHFSKMYNSFYRQQKSFGLEDNKGSYFIWTPANFLQQKKYDPLRLFYPNNDFNYHCGNEVTFKVDI